MKLISTGRPALILAGPYNYPAGYGVEVRGFIDLLDQAVFDFRILPTHQERRPGLLTSEQAARYALLEQAPVDLRQAVVVQHSTVDSFNDYIRGRINIGRTMFETDRIPPHWAERCNRMDEIWVPSHFNIETFGDSGVSSDKLRVVPGGVDANLFHPAAPPLELKGKKGFVFLSNFGWVDRKGWDILLTAYCTEFQAEEDVALVIKTIRYLPASRIEEQFNSFIAQLKLKRPAPTINIINSELPSSLMPGLYTACNAFVLPSRGEGWGLPYLEAMACGLPVIGTRWSSNLEFMNDENSYLIEIEGLEDVPANVDMPIYSGHKWARPSVSHLRRLMRYVFEHPQERRTKGDKARADACQRWTWDHAAAAIFRQLAKYYA